MPEFDIIEVNNTHRHKIKTFLQEQSGSEKIISRGKVQDASQLPSFIVLGNDAVIGLATYHIIGDQCELVTLDSLFEGQGIGAALLYSVVETAYDAGCKRVWLITSNDNTNAIRFYQTRNFRLVAVHRDAITEARKIKPEIPIYGFDSIPIRDEVELEFYL